MKYNLPDYKLDPPDNEEDYIDKYEVLCAHYGAAELEHLIKRVIPEEVYEEALDTLYEEYVRDAKAGRLL